MAAMLKSAAAAAINKGQHSAYYGDDKGNPVFVSLEQEIKLFQANILKQMNTEQAQRIDGSLARS